MQVNLNIANKIENIWIQNHVNLLILWKLATTLLNLQLAFNNKISQFLGGLQKSYLAEQLTYCVYDATFVLPDRI